MANRSVTHAVQSFVEHFFLLLFLHSIQCRRYKRSLEVKIAAQKVFNKFLQLYATADKYEVSFVNIFTRYFLTHIRSKPSNPPVSFDSKTH